ncbi:DUF1440 domain-containing protein [Algibacter sp. L4_22]|uniref:DUF1440 domain-containing protein n=1 Tax=Algibacter sp. L4_22 TaxID=2942477 RepID=UPI00201B869D|nr:DUF1440 domain-containing protein [Algibacter sp. L4_22]MCL5129306.1 DUF1440 domain-containing protein [Algibacter sp. L4_22]
MNTKIKQGLLGGIAATAVMTAFMMIAAVIGMPKMSPPEMLATMMGLPIFVGWIMHFIIGVIFALVYAFFFINWVKRVNNNVLKGVIFGVSAFILAQIAIGILVDVVGGMPVTNDNTILILISGVVGHVVFGIVIALLIKNDEHDAS